MDLLDGVHAMLAFQTDEIITKLSLKRFVLIKKRYYWRIVRYISINIIEKLSIKTSKAMKLSKIYLLKKSKSDEIIYFTFPFIDAHSKIRRGKRQHWNHLFADEGGMWKKTRIWQFWAIPAASLPIISLFTTNHPFTLKALNFCPKSITFFVLKPLYLLKIYL